MLSYIDEAPSLACTNQEYRHWCPLSERFTGCDALFSAIEQGWQVKGVVFCQTYKLGRSHSARQTLVYHFQLVRGDELIRMPVINSPHVLNYINACDLLVFDITPIPRETPTVEAVAVRIEDTTKAKVKAYTPR